MNLKRILISALLSASFLGAMAVPARPGVRTFRQSDGTEICVKLIGDEHFHTYVTTDGLTVARGNDGDFYYQTAVGLTSIKAHNPELRKVAEVDFIKQQMNEMNLQAMVKSRQTSITKRKAQSVQTRAGSATQVPTMGSPRIPILLVEYKDKKFKDRNPLSTFNDFFANGETCAAQYFADQSNGKFTPEFDVYGPYTLSENREVYGGNDGWGNDKALGRMVAETALGLNSEIDYSLYDNDGDGECDVLIVLYAGDGEASSNDLDAENSVWPCQWNLSASDYKEALNLDGTKIDKFACFNELNGRHPSQIDGIGTFCHEFSHCLGLPDFYDTNYKFFGMGPWSLMDSGSYNNDTYTPIGYSAYEKEFMGWIEIEEGAENTYYTLPVFNQKNLATDKAVKLSNPLDENEYFILENRACQGWDEYLSTEGLFIYHVTYNPGAWEMNTVNNFETQRMTPVPADDRLKMYKVTYDGYNYSYEVDESDLLGDLWPYNGNNSFTRTSSPSQKLNIGGGFLDKPVTEIVINDDGTASFWVMKLEVSPLPAPALKDPLLLSSQSAVISWNSGLERQATFTCELTEKGDEDRVTTIEGIEGNTYTLADLTPGGLYEYRIKAIPLDKQKYTESGWSASKTIDLSSMNGDNSGIESIDAEVEAEYFTLQGVKIAKPQVPGVYIVKKGSKSFKMAM